jgi:hypothetical protein
MDRDESTLAYSRVTTLSLIHYYCQASDLVATADLDTAALLADEIESDVRKTSGALLEFTLTSIAS